MSAPYPDSYYAATCHPAPTPEQLVGEARCDVAILGGGLTGLSAALELAERGYRVVLLEAQQLGWGASGRNGGQVLNGYSADTSAIIDNLGLETARALITISNQAVALVKQRVAQHTIACDLTPGYVMAALKPRQLRALTEETGRLARDMDETRLQVWDRDQFQNAVHSPRYCGGVYDPDGAHLHPLNFCLGLAKAARAAGARLYELSPVRRVEDGAAPCLITDHGRVHADWLLICGDGYLGPTYRPASDHMMPVASCIVATEPLGTDRLASLFGQPLAVADANTVLDYFRPSADGRLVFGGLADYAGREPADIRAALRPRLERVFPQLTGVTLSHGWGGLIGLTRNRLPQITRTAPHTLIAQGYSGHGVALATLAGQILAETIAGQSGRFDLFSQLPRPDFPGGVLRTPALILGMLFYRLRDLIP